MLTRKITCWLAGTAVLATACTAPAIRGTWNGGDGQVVVLQQDGLRIDSAVVRDEKFRLPAQAAGGQVAELLFAGTSAPVYIDGSAMQLSLATDESGTGHYTLTKGGAEQRAMADVAGILYRQAQLRHHVQQLFSDTTSHSREYFAQAFDDCNRAYEVLDNDAKALSDASAPHMASLVLIDRYYLAPEINRLQPAKALLDRTSGPVRTSAYGQQIQERLQRMLDVHVGGQAPDIALPSPAGDTVHLSSLRGKWVILDFWASWCVPCMEEMPNLKRIYADYHARGLEIYGVSSDKQADAWTKTIRNHHLDWIHVSGLNTKSGSETRARYLVTGIPCILLIDPDGKIVARDVRGQALTDAVAEHLGK